MTDEARIARLTELARRVWPDAEADAARHNDVVTAAAVFLPDGLDPRNPDNDEAVLALRHPRAFDALEAALLVLVGAPTDADQHEALVSRYKALTQEVSGLWAILARVEQWAEKHGPMFEGGRELSKILYGDDPSKAKSFAELREHASRLGFQAFEGGERRE